MQSGLYGSRDHFSDIRRRRKNNISERLMWRKLGFEPRGSYRRANRLISQACRPFATLTIQLIDVAPRKWSRQPLLPIKSSTTILEPTAANSPTMAIFSSRARRTSKYACTILRTPMNGDITKRLTTLLVNGPLPTRRSHLIIAGWPIPPSDTSFASLQRTRPTPLILHFST